MRGAPGEGPLKFGPEHRRLIAALGCSRSTDRANAFVIFPHFSPSTNFLTRIVAFPYLFSSSLSFFYIFLCSSRAFGADERRGEEKRGTERRVAEGDSNVGAILDMFDTEKFIEEIEKRPAIYDVNRSEYNDRNAKMTAWDEVCQVMVPNWARLTDEERNVEEKNLRGKWRNIRDYFMKELKLQKSQKLGPAGRKRKKYMYFDQLLFLMPTVENKRNAGTALSNCKSEESEGEVDNPVIEEYDVPLAHAAPSIATGREYLQPGASYKMCPRYPKQLCETSFTSFDNEIHDILSSHSSQRVAYDEDDYDKMFLLSLLPIIRQVPEEKKLDVRIQMQQVLALALRPPDNKQ